MKNTLKTIVFFGTDDFSLATLKALIKADYNIAAVVTKPDSKSGRGQVLNISSVKKFADEQNINVLQPANVSDINSYIESLGNDIAGVLVSFGKIIPQSTIDLFSPGIINIHPSLLPKYRGPSPIETAIENGDNFTGVSIMQLTSGMDAGPVYIQVEHTLPTTKTRTELHKELASLGANLLIEILPEILGGLIKPKLQNESLATYCKLLDKKNAWLTPATITANQAERLVRAHLDFPKTKLNIFSHDIIVTKAHVASIAKSPLDILCNDNKYLSIDELKAPSGRTMSAADFLNGHS